MIEWFFDAWKYTPTKPDVTCIVITIQRNILIAISYEAPLYYLLSISWYKEFDFLISRNEFLISRNRILYIKQNRESTKGYSWMRMNWEMNSWYQEMNSWYQEIFFDIKSSISWYQEIKFLISRIWFLDIKKWVLDIKNSISWYQEIKFLISRNAE